MIRFVTFITALLIATPASAFVQTQTCSETGELGQFKCGPGEDPKPVHWEPRCIAFYVYQDGSRDLDGGTIKEATLDAIRASFGAWSSVADADVIVRYAGLTDEDRAIFDDSTQNANIIIWRDTEWPYASRTAFAITSVTFNPSNGAISDADIEFTGENHRFTNSEENAIVDLQNTLTHEAGHFLGLDHSAVAASTMFGSAPNGELEKRTLHPDDIDGLQSAYPPIEGAVTCSELPDFYNRPNIDDGCCATAGSSVTPYPLLILLAMLGRRRRRRRV